MVYLQYCSGCISSSVLRCLLHASVSGVLASFPGSLLKKRREERVVVTFSRKAVKSQYLDLTESIGLQNKNYFVGVYLHCHTNARFVASELNAPGQSTVPLDAWRKVVDRVYTTSRITHALMKISVFVLKAYLKLHRS